LQRLKRDSELGRRSD